MDELRLTSPSRYVIATVLLWFSLVMCVVTAGNAAAAWQGAPVVTVVVLAVVLPLAPYAATVLARIRDVTATAAGLRVRRLRGRRTQEVPWARIRRMELRMGRNGWAWMVDHDGPAGPVRVMAPCWAGGGGTGTPPQVERVRALWSAAAGPVALRARRGRLELAPAPPGDA